MQLLHLLMKYQEPVKVHSQGERTETEAMRKYGGDVTNVKQTLPKCTLFTNVYCY